MQREARQPAREGLVDVEPPAAGVHGHLVRVAQSVGDDGGAARVDAHDEAVGDVGATLGAAAGAYDAVLLDVEPRTLVAFACIACAPRSRSPRSRSARR